MKTNYIGHDEEYKKRLAAGACGWDASDDGYEVHQSKLAAILADGYAPISGRLLELGLCGSSFPADSSSWIQCVLVRNPSNEEFGECGFWTSVCGFWTVARY